MTSASLGLPAEARYGTWEGENSREMWRDATWENELMRHQLDDSTVAVCVSAAA